MNSLYVHIPFCASKCPYCDFYSVAPRFPLGASHRPPKGGILTKQEQFVTCCVEILQLQENTWRTAYIGGGTPSVLAPALLARLLAAIECEGEFTIECIPTSITPEFCRVIAQSGANRVSMGVQSAVPSERKALGRSGGLDEITQALALLNAEGMKNLSLDVMLGIPGQSIESLTETLAFCAKYAKHISAYLLKIEPGTPFAAHPPEKLPDEDAQAELYLHACEWLEAHGFAQYEISNFAMPGYESQHNLNYWRCGEYFAIGPAAHGFTQRRRWHYERDLAAFLRGDAPIDDGPGGDFEERAMLALRLNEGFQSPSARMLEQAEKLPGLVEVISTPPLACGHLPQGGDLGNLSKAAVAARASPLGEMPRSDRGGSTIKLTREGFLLSNMIIGRLLG